MAKNIQIDVGGKKYKLQVPDNFDKNNEAHLNAVRQKVLSSSQQTSTATQEPYKDYTAGDAMLYATKLGLLDTYRGAKQILNIDEDEMAEEQELLQKLMKNPEYGGRVTAAYFGGMIVDPVGWFIPAAKARTAAKMAMHGAKWGLASGATGYVDPEIDSLIGAGKMGRVEQAAMGAVGGAAVAPAMGWMMNMAKKSYSPAGEKVWKSMTKHPEIGSGAAGSLVGYNIGEDTTVREDLYNALLGAAAGATGGAGLRGLNKTTFGGRVEKGWLKRFTVPDADLTPDFLMKRGLAKKEANVIAREFNEVIKKIQEEDDATRELLYKALVGDFPMDHLHPNIKGMAREARDVMTKYGRHLVDLKVLHPDTFAKNMDTYIHRVFKNPAFHDRKMKFAAKTDDQIESIGDELKMRGKIIPMTGEQWEIDGPRYLRDSMYDVVGIVQKGKNKITHLDDEMMGKLRRGEIHAGSIETITVRKNWTPEELAEMGEVTDAAIALNRTAQLMSNDVAAHRFFKTISEEYAKTPKLIMSDRGLAHDIELPEGYYHKAVPSNPSKYGELAGKYLPIEMYHDIVTMDKWRSGAMFRHPIAKGYRTLNSWWKLTKTAYNAPVHANNFSSNIVMYDLNGGSIKGLRNAFKDLLFPTKRGESDRLKMAREYDVFGGNYIGNEVLEKNKQLYGLYNTSFRDGGTMDDVFNKVPDTILKVGKQAKRFTLDKAQEVYTWEDNLFRMGLFNTLIDNGVDPLIAAKKAREGFVDYSRSAPLLEVLKHSALPFASYAYGIVPRLGEAAAKTPWKFAKWAAIIGGVNAIGEDLTNDPEKIARERLLMGSDQDRRLFELPFAPTTMLKLPPQLSPKGTDGSMYWNVSRSIPGQAFQFTDQGYRVPGLPDVMQPTFGAIGSLAAGAYGLNLFTGENIPDAKGRAAEIGKAFTPNLPIPGLPTYAGEKARRGLTPGGFKSETKENHTLLTSTLQNLGIRVQTIDENKLGIQQYYRFKNKYDAIAKKLRKLERDFSEGMYANNQQKYEKKQKQLFAEMQSLEEKMMRKGL